MSNTNKDSEEQGIASEQAQKKSPFDDLNRDELLKKCKNLLLIAQKAKQAKDESIEEIKSLKETLSQYEIQKIADKESLKAMQEIVEKLNNDKLTVANDLESFKRKYVKWEKEHNDTKHVDHTNLATENESLKVQLNKMIAENKGLIEDLTNLEKKYIREMSSSQTESQTNEIEKLTAELKRTKDLVDEHSKTVEFLQAELLIKNDEVHAMEAELQKVKADFHRYQSKREENDVDKFEAEEKVALLEDQIEGQVSQIKSQEEKIAELTVLLEGLKNSPSEEEANKLQTEVAVLTDRVAILEAESVSKSEVIEQLKQEKTTLETQCDQLRDESKKLDGLETIKAELEKYKELTKILQSQLDDCNETRSAKTMECEKLKKELNDIENLQKQLEEKENKIKDLEQAQDDIKQKYNDLQSVHSDLTRQVDDKTSRLQEIEENELKNAKEKLNQLAQETEALKLQLAERESSTDQIVQSTKELDALKDLLKAKEQRIHDLEENELKTALDKLRLTEDQVAEATRITEVNQALCKQIDEYRQEVETIKQLHTVDLDKKQEEIIRLRADFEEQIHRQNLAKTQESAQINDLNQELESLRLEKEEEIDALKIELQQIKDDKDLKNEEIGSLTHDIENLKKKLQDTSEAYVAEINDLKKLARLDEEAKNNEIQSLKLKCEQDREKHHIELINLRSALDETNAKMVNYKTENIELLDELKEINEILKQRGEVISLQLTKINDLENAKTDLETKLNSTNQSISVELEEHKVKVENLQQLVRQLEAKLSTKDECPSRMDDSMSTSTISRADEPARMKEFEDSYEEKYNKLRALAVKLKKKVTDQTALIVKLEDEAKVHKGSHDQTVALMNEKRALDEKIIKLEEEINELKKVKASDSGDGGKVQKASSEEAVGSDKNVPRDYQNQIKSLKMEKDALNTVIKELNLKIEKLSDSIASKEKSIKDLSGNLESLQTELTTVKATAKKTSVLSLEIEAFERSHNELNAKLTKKKQEVEDLEAAISNQNGEIESLKNQISILEENLDSEKSHAGDLKKQVDVLQGKQRESEHEKSELRSQIEDLTRQLDKVKIEISDQNQLFTSSMADKERLLSTMEAENIKNAKTVLTLEEKLETALTDLKNREMEVETLKTDFASYKVRAQSVLRQNQFKDVGREKELEEELQSLRDTYQKQLDKAESLLVQNSQLTKEIEGLKDDKLHAVARSKDLLALIDELKQQNDTFAEETQKKITDLQESYQTQRLQNETLRVCYENQIHELIEKHNKEVTALKASLSEVSVNTIPSAPVNDSLMHQNDDEVARFMSPYSAPTTDEQKINMIMLQREEGEGSESTTHPLHHFRKPSRNRRELIPLDELLNTSLDDNYTEDRSISPTIELQQARDKLKDHEAQVKHLTSLLAEAEQDLTKMTQMNDVLKEEVRRQQRSIEREQHVHNSEYLKNVVFKFLTLNSGDERSRLVPVLNTILRLSPDETQKLQSVAKGGEGLSRLTGMLWSNNN